MTKLRWGDSKWQYCRRQRTTPEGAQIQVRNLFLEVSRKKKLLEPIYFLHFTKLERFTTIYGDSVAREFPANDDQTSCVNEGPALSAVPWPIAYRPWALAELTRHRPFVDTGRLIVIRRKLPSDRVTLNLGKAFLLFETEEVRIFTTFGNWNHRNDVT